MSHTFKDHSREHQMARDSIKANTTLIMKYSTDLQHNVAELQELLTVASWYISDQMIQIDEHYDDAPLDHLKRVNGLYAEYCNELITMDTVLRQLIYAMNRYFDFSNVDIQDIKERVQGDM